MSTLYLFLSFPESKCIYLGFSMFEAWCCVMISRRIVEPRWAWCDETRLRYESHEKNKNSVGKHLLTTLAPPEHSGGQTHSCLHILSRLHWLIRDLIKINIEASFEKSHLKCKLNHWFSKKNTPAYYDWKKIEQTSVDFWVKFISHDEQDNKIVFNWKYSHKTIGLFRSCRFQIISLLLDLLFYLHNTYLIFMW